MFDRTSSDLGSAVGQINGEDINANQLERRGYDWKNGYGAPSDEKDINGDGHPVIKITKDAKSIIFQSRFGSTKLLASEIARKTDAGILENILRTHYLADNRKTLKAANREKIQNDPPGLAMDLPESI